MTHSEVAGYMGSSEKLISQICNQGHIPRKSIVITLGLVLGLNLLEINFLLYFAGYTLQPSIAVDRIYIQVIKETVGKSGCDRVLYGCKVSTEENLDEKKRLGGKSYYDKS